MRESTFFDPRTFPAIGMEMIWIKDIMLVEMVNAPREKPNCSQTGAINKVEQVEGTEKQVAIIKQQPIMTSQGLPLLSFNVAVDSNISTLLSNEHLVKVPPAAAEPVGVWPHGLFHRPVRWQWNRLGWGSAGAVKYKSEKVLTIMERDVLLLMKGSALLY